MYMYLYNRKHIFYTPKIFNYTALAVCFITKINLWKMNWHISMKRFSCRSLITCDATVSTKFPIVIWNVTFDSSFLLFTIKTIISIFGKKWNIYQYNYVVLLVHNLCCQLLLIICYVIYVSMVFPFDKWTLKSNVLHYVSTYSAWQSWHL